MQHAKLTFGDRDVLVTASCGDDGPAGEAAIREAAGKAFAENDAISSVYVNEAGEVTHAYDENDSRVGLEGTGAALDGRVLMVPNAAALLPAAHPVENALVGAFHAVVGAVSALANRIVERITGGPDQKAADALLAYELRPGVALADAEAIEAISAADIVEGKGKFLEAEAGTLFETVGLDKEALEREAAMHLEAAGWMRDADKIRGMDALDRRDKTHALHRKICDAIAQMEAGQSKLIGIDWRLDGELVMVLVEVTKGADGDNTIRFFNCSDRLASLFPSVGLPSLVGEGGQDAVAVQALVDQVIDAPNKYREGYEFAGISQDDLETVLLPLLLLQTAELEPEKAEETSFFLIRWIKAFLGRLVGAFEHIPRAIRVAKAEARGAVLEMEGLAQLERLDFLVDEFREKGDPKDEASLKELAEKNGLGGDPALVQDIMEGIFSYLKETSSEMAALGALREVRAGQPCSKVMKVRDRCLYPEQSRKIQFKYMLDRFYRTAERMRPVLGKNESYRLFLLEYTDRIEAFAVKHGEELFGADLGAELQALAVRMEEIRDEVGELQTASDRPIAEQVAESGQVFRGDVQQPAGFVREARNQGTVATSTFEPTVVTPLPAGANAEQMQTVINGWLEQTRGFLAANKHEQLRDVCLQMIEQLRRPELDVADAYTALNAEQVVAMQNSVAELGRHLTCALYHRMAPYAETDIHRWSMRPSELRAMVRVQRVLDRLVYHPANPAAADLAGTYYDHANFISRLTQDPYTDDGRPDGELMSDLVYFESKARQANAESISLKSDRVYGEDSLYLDRLVARAEADGVDIMANLNPALRYVHIRNNGDEEDTKRKALLIQTEFQQYIPEGVHHLRSQMSQLCVLIAPQHALIPGNKMQMGGTILAVAPRAIGQLGARMDAEVEQDPEEKRRLEDELNGQLEREAKAIIIRRNCSGLRHCKEVSARFDAIKIPISGSYVFPFRFKPTDLHLDMSGTSRTAPYTYGEGRSMEDDFRRGVAERGVEPRDVAEVLRRDKPLTGLTLPESRNIELDRDAARADQYDQHLGSYNLPGSAPVHHLPVRFDQRSFDGPSASVHAILGALGDYRTLLNKPALQRDLEKRLLRPGAVEALCATDEQFATSLVELLNMSMSQANFYNDVPAKLFLGRLAFRIRGRLEALNTEIERRKQDERDRESALEVLMGDHLVQVDDLFPAPRGEVNPRAWQARAMLVAVNGDDRRENWKQYHLAQDVLGWGRHGGDFETLLVAQEGYPHLNEVVQGLPDYHEVVGNTVQGLGQGDPKYDAFSTLIHQHYLYSMIEKPRGDLTVADRPAIIASYCAMQSHPPAIGWEEPALTDRLERWMRRNLAEWHGEVPTQGRPLAELLAPAVERLVPEFEGDRNEMVWTPGAKFPLYTCHVGLEGRRVELVLDLARGHLFIDGRSARLYVPSDIVDQSPAYRQVFGEKRVAGTMTAEGGREIYHIDYQGRQLQVQRDEEGGITVLWHAELEEGSKVWVQFVEKPVGAQLGELPARILGCHAWINPRDKKTYVFSNAQGDIQMTGVRTSEGLKNLMDWSTGEGRPLYNLGDGGLPVALRALECCNHVRVTQEGISFDRLGLLFKAEQLNGTTVYSCERYPGYILDEEQQAELFDDGFAAGVVLCKRSDPTQRTLLVHAQELLPHEPGNPVRGSRKGSRQVWFDRKPTELEPGRLLALGLGEDDAIESRDADVNIYLAYLNLGKRNYAQAARLLERALTDAPRSDFYNRVAGWMARWEDKNPSGIAVRLKLIANLAHKDQSLYARKGLKNEILGVSSSELLKLTTHYHRAARTGDSRRRVELTEHELRRLSHFCMRDAGGLVSHLASWYVRQAAEKADENPDIEQEAAIGDPRHQLGTNEEWALQAAAYEVCKEMDFDDRSMEITQVIGFMEKRDGWGRDFPMIYRRLQGLDLTDAAQARELETWLLCLRASWPLDVKSNALRRLLWKAAKLRKAGEALGDMPPPPQWGRPLGDGALLGIWEHHRDVVDGMLEWVTALENRVPLHHANPAYPNPFQEVGNRIQAMEQGIGNGPGFGEMLQGNPLEMMQGMLANPAEAAQVRAVFGPLQDPARSPLTAPMVDLFLDGEQGIRLVGDVQTLILATAQKAAEFRERPAQVIGAGNMGRVALAGVGGAIRGLFRGGLQGARDGAQQGVQDAVIQRVGPAIAIRIIDELRAENDQIDPNLLQALQEVRDAIDEMHEELNAAYRAFPQGDPPDEAAVHQWARAQERLMEQIKARAAERMSGPMRALVGALVAEPLKELYGDMGLHDGDIAVLAGFAQEKAAQVRAEDLRVQEGEVAGQLRAGLTMVDGVLAEASRARREAELDRILAQREEAGVAVPTPYSVEIGGLFEETVDADGTFRDGLTGLFFTEGVQVNRRHWDEHERRLFADDDAFPDGHHRALRDEIHGAHAEVMDGVDDRTWSVDRAALRTQMDNKLDAIKEREAELRRQVKGLTRASAGAEMPQILRDRERGPSVEAVLNLFENDRLELLHEVYHVPQVNIDDTLRDLCESLDIAIIARQELEIWMGQLNEMDALAEKLEDRRLSSKQRRVRNLEMSVRARTLHGLIEQRFYYVRGAADPTERLKLGTQREEKWIIRRNQLDITNAVILDPQKASQDRLGIGKSSMICKHIGAKMADGVHLFGLVAITADLGQAQLREDRDTRARFRRDRVYRFDFGEHSKTDSASLHEQLITFKELAVHKGFMVTTKEAILLFRDKYLETWLRLAMAEQRLEVAGAAERATIEADIAEIHKQLDYWSDSMVFLKDHLRLVCDEIDQVLDPTDMVNLAMSQIEKLDTDMRDIGIGVVQKILGNARLQDMLGILTDAHASRVNLPAGEADCLGRNDRNRLEFVRIEVGYLYAEEFGFVTEQDKQLFAAYVSGNHQAIDGVRQFYGAHIRGHEQEKKIVVLKEYLSSAFGVLCNEGNVQYGRMHDGVDVGPYGGSKTPLKGSRISDPFEWVLSLALDYAREGVTVDQVGAFVNNLKEQAFKAARREDPFPEAEEFERNYGVSLLAVTPEHYAQIAVAINQSWETKTDFALRWVLPNLSYNPYQVQGTSAGLPWLAKSTSGFSGTMALLWSFANSIHKDEARDPTVDMDAIRHGLRWAVDNGHIGFMEERGNAIETTMLACRGYDGLCDSGAMLKNYTVDEAVSWAATRDNIEQVMPGCEWIQYIEPKSGLWRVRRVHSRGGKIEDKLAKDVHGRNPEKTFIFYFEPDTRGKDDRGFFSRKLFVTAGDKQRLTKVVQTFWRNRGLARGQGLAIGVPTRLRPVLGFAPGDNPSPEQIYDKLIQWLVRQEADYQVPNNMKGETHKLKGYMETRIFEAMCRVRGHRDRSALRTLVERVHRKSTAPNFDDLTVLGGLNEQDTASNILRIMRNHSIGGVRSAATLFATELLGAGGLPADDMQWEGSAEAKRWVEEKLGMAPGALGRINENRGSQERRDLRMALSMICHLWDNRQGNENMSAEGIEAICQALTLSLKDLATHEFLPAEKLPAGEMPVPKANADSQVMVMQMQLEMELEEAAAGEKMDIAARPGYITWPYKWKNGLSSLFGALADRGRGGRYGPELVQLRDVSEGLFEKGLISANLGVRQLSGVGRGQWSNIYDKDVEPYTYVLHLYNAESGAWVDVAISRHEFLQEVKPMLRADHGRGPVRAYVTRLDTEGGKVVAAGRNRDPDDWLDHRFRRDRAKWINVSGCVDLPSASHERAFVNLFRAQPPQQCHEAQAFAADLFNGREEITEADLAAALAEVAPDADVARRAARDVARRPITRDRQHAIRFVYEELRAERESPVNREKVKLGRDLAQAARSATRPGMEAKFSGSAVERVWKQQLGAAVRG